MDEKNSKLMQKMLEQKQFENSWEVEKRNSSVEQEEPFLEKNSSKISRSRTDIFDKIKSK